MLRILLIIVAFLLLPAFDCSAGVDVRLEWDCDAVPVQSDSSVPVKVTDCGNETQLVPESGLSIPHGLGIAPIVELVLDVPSQFGFAHYSPCEDQGVVRSILKVPIEIVAA